MNSSLSLGYSNYLLPADCSDRKPTTGTQDDVSYCLRQVGRVSDKKGMRSPPLKSKSIGSIMIQTLQHFLQSCVYWEQIFKDQIISLRALADINMCLAAYESLLVQI